MRRTRGWLALWLALLAGQARAQTRIEERWPLDSGGSVRVASPFGGIRVVRWDADSVAVAARRGPPAGRLYAAGGGHVRHLGVHHAAGPREHEVPGPRGATTGVQPVSACLYV